MTGLFGVWTRCPVPEPPSDDGTRSPGTTRPLPHPGRRLWQARLTMSALSDLLASHTRLDERQTAHLQQLVAEWQLLADLSFADLLLWVPTASEGEFLCAAQCRPTTGATAYLLDRVGERLAGQRAAALGIALAEGRIFRESDPDWEGDTPIRR